MIHIDELLNNLVKFFDVEKLEGDRYCPVCLNTMKVHKFIEPGSIRIVYVCDNDECIGVKDEVEYTLSRKGGILDDQGADNNE